MPRMATSASRFFSTTFDDSSSVSSVTKKQKTFSTQAAAQSTDLQQSLLQRLCWEAYLGSGRGSDTLFKSIDVDMCGYISRENLLHFIDSVEGKGVNPKAFKIIDVLADDHRIDLKEFKSWLIM